MDLIYLYNTPLQSAPAIEIIFNDIALLSTRLCPAAEVEQRNAKIDIDVQNPDNFPSHLKACMRWFDDYFDGIEQKPPFQDIQACWKCSDFALNVYLKLSGCPSGRVWTYGELAGACGHPKAARAVGLVLNKNPFHLIVPCHRVISKTGDPYLFQAGAEVKRELLERENAVISSALRC